MRSSATSCGSRRRTRSPTPSCLWAASYPHAADSSRRSRSGRSGNRQKETKKSKHTKNKTTQPNAQETLEKTQKAPTDHPQPTLSPRPESRPDPARALILETKKRTTNSLPLDAPPFELPLSPPPLVVRRLCDRRRVRFRAPRSDALGMCVHSTRQGNSIPDMWGKRGCDIWGKGGVSANEKKSARVKTHALP